MATGAAAKSRATFLVWVKVNEYLQVLRIPKGEKAPAVLGWYH